MTGGMGFFNGIMIKIIGFIFIGLFIHSDSLAHSGGTNAEGCHHNRKTGEYHCHNKKSKSPPIEKTETPSEVESTGMASSQKPSGLKNKNRIFQWVDDQGEIHYSKEMSDLPTSGEESKNSE
ncbi:MAG: hypothetical protein NPINA01_16150 [Nitrospinaceae bacterium]|nr:MAG: hypothetical protein NPINA01_16150 [Nitrospinaceae bacterium]